jgi:hypothetical protein
MKAMNTAIVASIILYSCSSLAADCASGKEKVALDSRALQSHLMVAALSCHIPESYNLFMRRFKSELVTQNSELGSYFSRRYGEKQSATKTNKFMTALANESSKRSLKIDSEEFCQITVKLFDKIMSVKPERLYQIAADKQFSSLHGIQGCSVASASN